MKLKVNDGDERTLIMSLNTFFFWGGGIPTDVTQLVILVYKHWIIFPFLFYFINSLPLSFPLTSFFVPLSGGVSAMSPWLLL